jgi:chromate transporter
MVVPGLAPLTALFLRIGNLTFGGGDPTMAVLRRELVDRRGWLSPSQYALVFSLARLTPGTNVLAFCAGAGWLLRGWLAAFLAVLATSLPSAILAVWLCGAYTQAAASGWAHRAFASVAACAAGMTLAGALLLVRPEWSRRPRYALCLVTAAFLASYLGVSPVVILALAALLGLSGKTA